MILKYMPRHIARVIFVFFVFFPIACNGGQMNNQTFRYQKLSDVPDSVWEKLSEKKIYFGHQSVGYNILDGLQAILNENPQIKLSIDEGYDPDMYKPGIITHSRIGYNSDPESKLNMFAFLAKSGGAENADIMFFKFCYVDFNTKTDVKALFGKYQATFKKLKTEYPKTTFIHLTVPLTTIQDGPKVWIKKILGRPVGGTLENIKRHEFSEMLRAAYAGNEPMLDIAAIESTFPDGTRSTFESNGKTYFSLVPDYTSDGGHLNQLGRKVVAEKLLLTLAGTI